MRMSIGFPLLLALATPVLAQEGLRLIPREAAGLPPSPTAVASSNFVSRSALSESSPFAAITATDPRLRDGAQPCAPGTANDISSPTLEPCAVSRYTYSRFVDSPEPIPLTGMQKGHLALRNVIDPGGLATLGGSSAFTILTNSHTAYGAGFGGLGRSFGIGLVQDATGQFFGTWAIPALAGEDARYHRMPHARISRRIVHALSHTVIAQHDDGRPMLNLATLGTYPISAEISNLYVPGVHGNAPSTVERVLTGYATDPVDSVITEFLPDVARHIQVHLVFTQQLLNQLSSEEYPRTP